MLKVEIENYLKGIVGEKIRVEVFTPEQANFGHYSTNVALKLAREDKKNPMEIAKEISGSLSSKAPKNFFEKIEIAPPGFINFWLSKETLQSELLGILEKRGKYEKKFQIPNSKFKIQIEYISANPTGPLTLANGRGGFMGDALANILEFSGYKIEREYYINDTGNQILTLGKSILANAGIIPFEEKFYKGEYVKDWARKNSSKIKKLKDNPTKIGQLAAKDFLKEIKAVIKKAGIKFDRWTSEEKDIHKKRFVKKALQIFQSKGYSYYQDGALWLKTTDFGDEKDRVLVTSDNFPTYFLADSGHFLETKTRSFDKKILILGPDHHGYVKRIQAAGKIVGLKDSEIIVTQAVRLMSGGKEIKMSKRAGEFVAFEDLLKEIKIDAARFFFLLHSAGSHMDFDLDLAKEQSMKNPVYYIQYAAVRCNSILQKVARLRRDFAKIDFNLLNTKEDLNLILILSKFEGIIQAAAENLEPPILARYVLDLARQFHNFYEKERIINEEEKLMEARLELIKATKIVLEKSFKILGVSMPKRM